MQVKRLNIDGKPLAYKEEVTTHTGNSTIHVTSADKTRWNNNFNPIYYSENTSSQTAQINANRADVYGSSSATISGGGVMNYILIDGNDGVNISSENAVNISGDNGVRLSSYNGTSFTVGPTNVSYGSLFCVGPDGVWLGTSENRVEVLKDDLIRWRIYDL